MGHHFDSKIPLKAGQDLDTWATLKLCTHSKSAKMQCKHT